MRFKSNLMRFKSDDPLSKGIEVRASVRTSFLCSAWNPFGKDPWSPQSPFVKVLSGLLTPFVKDGLGILWGGTKKQKETQKPIPCVCSLLLVSLKESMHAQAHLFTSPPLAGKREVSAPLAT